MTEPKLRRAETLEDGLRGNTLFIVQKICAAIREKRYSDAIVCLAPIAEHAVSQKKEGIAALGKNSSGESILETLFLIDEKRNSPFSQLDKETQEIIVSAFQCLPGPHRGMPPLAKLLTTNMLAEAILRPRGGIENFFYCIAKNYLRCAGLRLEEYLQDPQLPPSTPITKKQNVAGNNL